MEAISLIQSIIDKNSEVIPEGDYLELCGATKQIFMDKTYVNQKLFEPIDNFPQQLDGLHGATRQYFQYVFEQQNRDIEYNVLNATLKALKSELMLLRPIKRITNKIKSEVVKSFANVRNLTLEENTEECLEKAFAEGKFTMEKSEPFKVFFKGLCNSYILLFNLQNQNTGIKLINKMNEIKDYLELI